MDDPDTVDAVFLSLGDDERLANDNDASDEFGLHPVQPMGREAASEEMVEPPAFGGEDVGIERNPPQGRPRLVASPASSPPPALPAEPGYAGGRADGPRPVEPILGSELGRNWNSSFEENETSASTEAAAADPARFFDANYTPVLASYNPRHCQERGADAASQFSPQCCSTTRMATNRKTHPGTGKE